MKAEVIFFQASVLVVILLLGAVPALAQIEINDIDELQLIGNDPGYPLDGDYVLGNDIDANATASWNDGAGFKPIAPDTDFGTDGYQGTAFTGSFDGQGYVISELTINRLEEDYAGLFGYASGAAIQNMVLENMSVSGVLYVGGLLGGASYSNIINSSSMGMVSGEGRVGGLVGGVSYSDIMDSTSEGVVSGTIDGVGGLMGRAIYSDIKDSYSTGVVSGRGDVGGFVGEFGYSNILNSYSTGVVSGKWSIGGLIGLAYYSNIMCSYSTDAVSATMDSVGGLVGRVYGYSSITHSYSVGAVSGNYNVGGLVGEADTITAITGCYWDMETSEQIASAGGIGKTTAEMMQQATFAGWDFTSVWSICENIYYPYLQFHPADNKVLVTVETDTVPVDLPVTFNVAFHLPVTGFDNTDVDFSLGSMTVTAYMVTNTGDNQNYTVEVTAASGTGTIILSIPDGVCSTATVCGTSTNIYAEGMAVVWNEINDVEGLYLIGNDSGYPLNGAYRLVKNIDASATVAWNNGAGFKPIGSDADPDAVNYQGPAFTGTFDGQGYVITGLSINRPTENHIGLFGYIDGATILNTALEKMVILGKDYVGGLVGHAEYNSTITDCYSTGAVSGTGDNVGGLAGSSSSNITSCYSTGVVSGTGDNIGGLVGCYACGSTLGLSISSISYCYSTATVLGTGDNVGGLVGIYVGCPTMGTSSSSIRYCYSTGAVSGEYRVGGLVGCYTGCFGMDFSTSSITDCYSIGAVSGGDEIGGFVGYVYGYSAIRRSYSMGTVSGGYRVGGLVGFAGWDSDITHSFSTSAVSGDDFVGGLVGEAGDSSTITSSYWDMETSGQTVSAGGIGKTTTEMMQQDTFANWDFTTIWGICEDVYYPYLQFHPADNKVLVTIEAATSPTVLPATFNIAFHLPVTDFDGDDVDFSSGSMTVTAYTVTNTGDDSNYTVDVVAASGTGTIVLSIPDGVCSAVTVCGTSANLYAEGMMVVWNEINDVNELQLIGNDTGYPLNGAYRLGNDIDAGVTATWNDGAGFVPIAPDTDPVTDYYQGTKFTGIFDGQGYAITDLVINRFSGNYSGLFACVDDATIRNVALKNMNVSGALYVGGLIGHADGSNITSSYSMGAVSGYEHVGGLVGSTQYSDITKCYSTGAVSGNYPDISDYADGVTIQDMALENMSVSVTLYAGGLVGDAWGSSIVDSYSTGAVSGSDSVGGLVGGAWDSNITGCYWDMETSGQTVSAGGVGKTTAAMMEYATFVGWDFTDTWDICPGISYPWLQNIPAPYPAPVPITVTIDQAPTQGDPANTQSVVFEVVFTMPVVEFDTDDLNFTGSTALITDVLITDTGDSIHYIVSVFSGTEGVITVEIPEGVIDVCGIMTNLASTSADNRVTVDLTPPSAFCHDLTASLDASGMVGITANDIDDGSYDTNGIQSMSVVPNVFTCDNLGANTVTLTVTDIAGNMADCIGTILVSDSFGACSPPVEGEGEFVEGEGESIEGEGESIEGEPVEGEGEPVEGEGEPVEGEGEPIEGEGEPVEGELIEGEGELIEGEGELIEGEGELIEGEGELIEGEGELIEGEGELVEGEGELIEGEGESIEGEGEFMEGEGESVEGEPVEGESSEGETQEEITDILEDAFDQIDSNGDGQISMGEVAAIYPDLSAADFFALDLDGDGFLSLAELQGSVDEEENCKCGCGNFCCREAETPSKTVKEMFADWLLIGLALMVMVAWSAMGYSRKE